jgi:hypothetical protein
MRRLRTTLARLAALAFASTLFAGSTLAIESRLTLDRAMASGWDCTPLILIGGHYHCSPPGKQAVTDIIAGTADSPSIVHTVFREDGQFAGTELLIRADLWAGQPCPTDIWLPVPPWLPEPTYFACHHFAFSAP